MSHYNTFLTKREKSHSKKFYQTNRKSFTQKSNIYFKKKIKFSFTTLQRYK
jgi:hypothetical protein